jgi:hypothetical protein
VGCVNREEANVPTTAEQVARHEEKVLQVL